METQELISVREYLMTDYQPDCDYVDGVVEERLWGERDHSITQSSVMMYFYERRRQWGIHVFPSLRMRVSATRVRVADVCIVAGDEPTEQILQSPPFICVEVISPEDRIVAVFEKTNDYLRFGVRYVFLLDGAKRRAYRCTADGMFLISELRTESPDTLVPLEALFE